MDALIIDATFSTPSVNFDPSGKLFIGGRSLPEDPILFFKPVFDWITNFKGDTMELDIRFEYLNTSSSKQVQTMFQHIIENKSLKSVHVNWFYEEGDDEFYESGKEIEYLTNLSFTFHEYAESAKF